MGGLLLIVGTTIGGGMLALPIANAAVALFLQACADRRMVFYDDRFAFIVGSVLIGSLCTAI